MLAVLEAGAVHVAAEDVHVEVVHAGPRVDADAHLARPVAARRESVVFCLSQACTITGIDISDGIGLGKPRKHGLPPGFGPAPGAEAALELLGHDGAEPEGGGLDRGPEGGVGLEGLKGRLAAAGGDRGSSRQCTEALGYRSWTATKSASK